MPKHGASQQHSDSLRGPTADDVAVIALDRRARGSEWPRVDRLTVSQEPKEFLPGPYDVFVSRFFKFGDLVAVSGEAGLTEFLQRPTALQRLIESCEMLGGPEPIEQRFLGGLEACLIRQGHEWRALSAEPQGRRVAIGLDIQRGRLYALREDDQAHRTEICYAEIPRGEGSLRWHRLCGLPTDATRFLDASLFIQGERGPCAVMRVLNQYEHVEHRLLSVEERAKPHGSAPFPCWSDPIGERYTILRPDQPTLGDLRQGPGPRGLLLEERITGGYRLSHLPKERCAPIAAFAYFHRAREAMKPRSVIPPVLNA